MAQGGSLLAAYAEQVKGVLFDPAEYFAGLPDEDGYTGPVILAATHGAVAGLCAVIWNLTGLSGPFIEGATEGLGFHLLTLLTALLAAVLLLFLGGAMLWVIGLLCGGRGEYGPAVRATAAMLVLYPLKNVLGFASGLSYSFSLGVSLALTVAGLRLLYLALTQALGANSRKAGAACAVLALIPVLMLLSGISYFHLIHNYQP